MQLDLVIPWWDPKLISRGTDTTQGGNTWSFSCLFSQVFKFHLPCKLLQAHCSPSYSGAGENTGLRQQNCYHLPLLLNLMVLWPRALSEEEFPEWALPVSNSVHPQGLTPNGLKALALPPNQRGPWNAFHRILQRWTFIETDPEIAHQSSWIKISGSGFGNLVPLTAE